MMLGITLVLVGLLGIVALAWCWWWSGRRAADARENAAIRRYKARPRVDA